MPISRLTCVLRHVDGTAGAKFETVDIDAGKPAEAIARARAHKCSTLGMTLSVCALTDETGAAIWTLRRPEYGETA